MENKSIQSLASNALRDAKGDPDRAKSLLDQWLRKDATVYQEVLDQMWKSALDTAIAHAMSTLRANIANSVRSQKEAVDVKGGQLWGQTRFYNFPLPGGQKLGNATKEDVLKGYQLYQAQSATAANRAKWLKRIADGLVDGKLVHQVFSEDELRDLAEKANI